MSKSTSRNTAADGKTQLTFTPEPEIAERLEKLRKITNLDLDQLLNTLLESPLNQIIGQGDCGLLRSLHPAVCLRR